MARALRSHLAGGRLFHVYARGVDSMVIFRDRRDRLSFLRLLATEVERHDWSCHAFCLMNTHVHLVLEAALERVSRGMHDLLGVYAMRFNTRHHRHGHLFGDRYGARVIETEDSLWRTVDYVLENPVRAGMVDAYEQWPWCGAAHLGREDDLDSIATRFEDMST
jgi:REP element-mobilizing transposase RayT